MLNTKKGGRNGSELVEISMGSDVGLAKGHKLFVYRADGKGKYLGTIRLDMVDYRTAVGVVIHSTKSGRNSARGQCHHEALKKSARPEGPAPALDVYVGLLLVSVGALIAGILCPQVPAGRLSLSRPLSIADRSDSNRCGASRAR